MASLITLFFRIFFGQKCKCCLNGIESFSSEDLLSELASGLPFRWFFIIGRPVVIKPFGIIWKNNADKRFYCRCCICFISFIILSPCFCWINFNKVLNFFGGWIDAFLTRRSIWNAFKWLFFNSLPYNHANYNMIFWKKYVIFFIKMSDMFWLCRIKYVHSLESFTGHACVALLI